MKFCAFHTSSQKAEKEIPSPANWVPSLFANRRFPQTFDSAPPLPHLYPWSCATPARRRGNPAQAIMQRRRELSNEALKKERRKKRKQKRKKRKQKRKMASQTEGAAGHREHRRGTQRAGGRRTGAPTAHPPRAGAAAARDSPQVAAGRVLVVMLRLRVPKQHLGGGRRRSLRCGAAAAAHPTGARHGCRQLEPRPRRLPALLWLSPGGRGLAGPGRRSRASPPPARPSASPGPGGHGPRSPGAERRP